MGLRVSVLYTLSPHAFLLSHSLLPPLTPQMGPAGLGGRVPVDKKKQTRTLEKTNTWRTSRQKKATSHVVQVSAHLTLEGAGLTSRPKKTEVGNERGVLHIYLSLLTNVYWEFPSPTLDNYYVRVGVRFIE